MTFLLTSTRNVGDNTGPAAMDQPVSGGHTPGVRSAGYAHSGQLAVESAGRLLAINGQATPRGTSIIR